MRGSALTKSDKDDNVEFGDDVVGADVAGADAAGVGDHVIGGGGAAWWLSLSFKRATSLSPQKKYAQAQ